MAEKEISNIKTSEAESNDSVKKPKQALESKKKM